MAIEDRDQEDPPEERPARSRRTLIIVAAIAAAVLVLAGSLAVRESIIGGQTKTRVRKTVVPNVQGYSLQVAYGVIASRGLCTGAITTRTSQGAAGVVIDQHPSAEKQVDALTRVSLVVSAPSAGSPPSPPAADLSRMNPACPSTSR